jgi:hypothetical protein
MVCFALKAGWRDEANQAIVIDLQERGLAAPSMTKYVSHSRAMVNHRTTKADVDLFVTTLHEAAWTARVCFSARWDPYKIRLAL